MSAPRRPSEVPGHGPQTDLLEQYWRHRLAVPRYGTRGLDPSTGLSWADRPTDEDIKGHLLASLAIAHELSNRLLQGRWCCVRDVLRAGGAVADVAAAMGLDDDEVRAGLRSWVDGQQRLHQQEGRWGLTSAEADDVRALVADRPSAAVQGAGGAT